MPADPPAPAPLQSAPVIVAFSAEVPEPGDYLTLPMSDPGVLLVRQNDGAVAAFLNRCRHRRRPVVIEAHGDGARGFICPFHAWRYGLDGDLTYAPKHDWPDGDGWAGMQRLLVIEDHGLILTADEPDAKAAAIQQGPANALQALRGMIPEGLTRVARAAVRTESELPTVMSSAVRALTPHADSLVAMSHEPAALVFRAPDDNANSSGHLFLLGPGTLIWRGDDGATLVRAKILRRGGCEVQIAGFAHGPAPEPPANRVAHILQEDTGAGENDGLLPLMATAFASADP
jgi:nitrite reductase/ring-hydroxylating ferredoxin subunit